MDHDHINEHGVVSLYVAGKLSPDERIGFEEHFVNCQQCLDQIELTDDLRSALKHAAKEDAALQGVGRLGVAPQLSRSPWVGYRIWQRPQLLAYATLVILLGLSTVFYTDARYRRSELDEVRRTSDDWQRRYADERQARETLEKQLAQRSDKGDQNQLEANLQPAPLFFLNVTRGADLEGSESANRITVPSTSPWIALSLEFEKDPAFRSYRARLNDAQGRQLWTAETISSPPSNAIAITLPSRLLTKGNYSVALDGLTSTGRYLPAAHFSFQAMPQK